MVRYLPILLLLIYLTLPSPALGAATKPEPIGTINDQNASWSEEIKFKRQARENKDGTLSLPSGGVTVGPQANELQFPNLTEINDAASGAIQFLLPEKLRQEFEASPPKEEILRGKIFHPVCSVRVNGQEREVKGAVPSTGSSEVTTPSWWSHLLAITKLTQAVSVPGNNSGVTFQGIGQEELDNLSNQTENASGNCRVASGPSDGQVERTDATGATTINVGSLFKSIVDLLSGLLTPGKTVPVEIIVKAKKLIPGESDFANQTSDKLGFLRSYCPEKLCPKKEEINEQEGTPYIDEDSGRKKLEYKGAAGARAGYELLVNSLYPQQLQGIPRPLRGPTAPERGGTGIFRLTGNPQSPLLENVIRDAAKAFEVPPGILAAVTWIEGVHMWNFSNDQVAQYSSPLAQDPTNCEPNGCRAAGPMQFVVGGIATDCQNYTGQEMSDIWSGYANAVNEKTGQNRNPNVCNIIDSIYAAAKKLKLNSTSSSVNWTEEEVFKAGSAYYGNCSTHFERLGDRTYCAFLWENYR